MNNKTKGTIILSVFWLIVLGGAIIVFLPFLWMILTSFKPPDEVITIPPKWIPSKFYWQNYPFIWSYEYGTPLWWRYYLNSVIVAVAQVSGVLLTSSLAAYAFARINFFARDTIFMLYLGTLMVPGTVTLIPMYLLMQRFGWLDKYQALIIPGLAGAYGTFLLRQFFMTIPQELEDAAYVDGASRLYVYWKIILPLGRPGLTALGLFTFMGSWNNFLWPLIVTTSEEMRTLPLGLSMLRRTGGWVRIEWGPLMAASTLAIVPVLILFICAQEYFIGGISLTGMKE